MKTLRVTQAGRLAKAALTVMSIMLFLSLTCNCAEAWWTYTELDNMDTGRENSLAVDTDGYIHISYYDGDNYILKYITNKNGSWQDPYVIDHVGIMARRSSIAIDSTGNVHIVYEGRNGEVKYTTNSTGAWVIETLGSGSNPSMSIDKSDNIHVCYNSDKLVYTKKNSWEWQTEEISMPHVFEGLSIASDLSGHVHISCTGEGYTTAPLQYVTNRSGSWQIEVLDYPGTLTSRDNDIVVDSSGYVHISYFSSSNHDLKYATNKSGSWKYEVVDNLMAVVFRNSINVDSSNHVHIMYTLRTDSTVSGDCYIRYAQNVSGKWTTDLMPGKISQTFGVSATSIYIDSFDNLHSCYAKYSSSSVALVYAIKPLRPIPTAEAGQNQIVLDKVTLDGSLSTDPDNDIVTYKWELWHDENASYSKTAEGVNPTVSDLQPGFYLVTLTVTDSVGNTSTDKMVVAVSGVSFCNGDVSGDSKVGLEEAIHALQVVAGVK